MIWFPKRKIKKLLKKLKALQHNRLHNPASEESLAQERGLYQALAKIYASQIGKKHYPNARNQMLAAYRAAALIDDAESQYCLASHLIEEGKFWQSVLANPLFENSVHNRLMQQCFEEALACLQAAEKLNHILAKRSLGLCYIQGFAVAVDKAKGFDLVVASIEQENSWDRVPQIFASIGLNKPEFFQALQNRNKP